MEQKSGKIHINPSDDEILRKQMTRLTEMEHNLVKDLPEHERPAVIALQRYLKDRAKLGRTGIGVQEKVAFKLGFKAGRETLDKATGIGP